MDKLCISTYCFDSIGDMDLKSRLVASAKMGYTGIEFLENNLKQHSLEEIKEMLTETGLEAVSLHCTTIAGISDYIPVMYALGGKMIIIPRIAFNNKAEAIEAAKKLEEKGREAAEYGLKVGYHNHTSEFREDEGKLLEEYLIENSDPKYVSIQLDCGWATAAGIDCAAFIEKYSGRFCAVHVKECNRILGAEEPNKPAVKMTFDESGKPVMPEEMKAWMRERTAGQCAMGDSTSHIGWKAIRAAADRQNNDCRWVVEREYDYCNDMLKCLTEDASWLLSNL